MFWKNFSFLSFFSFSLFLFFLFTSCLSLLLHLRIVLARYLPCCMQRTLSHVISPTCELTFFCATLLLVVCGVVFLSTIFLMSYNLQIFLYLIQISFSFWSLCDFTILMITFPKLLCSYSSYVLFHETCNLYFAKLTFYLPGEGISHMMSAVFASC